jgi:hypothetical protein
MTDLVALTDRVPALAASGARIAAALATGRLDAMAVADATAIRVVAAGTLSPAPRDPREHLRAAHVTARGHLTRLAEHDPAAEVARYVEATRPLTDNLRKAHARADDANAIYVNSYGDVRTPDQVVDEVLSVEGDVLRNAA